MAQVHDIGPELEALRSRCTRLQAERDKFKDALWALRTNFSALQTHSESLELENAEFKDTLALMGGPLTFPNGQANAQHLHTPTQTTPANLALSRSAEPQIANGISGEQASSALAELLENGQANAQHLHTPIQTTPANLPLSRAAEPQIANGISGEQASSALAEPSRRLSTTQHVSGGHGESNSPARSRTVASIGRPGQSKKHKDKKKDGHRPSSKSANFSPSKHSTARSSKRSNEDTSADAGPSKRVRTAPVLQSTVLPREVADRAYDHSSKEMEIAPSLPTTSTDPGILERFDSMKLKREVEVAQSLPTSTDQQSDFMMAPPHIPPVASSSAGVFPTVDSMELATGPNRKVSPSVMNFQKYTPDPTSVTVVKPEQVGVSIPASDDSAVTTSSAPPPVPMSIAKIGNEGKASSESTEDTVVAELEVAAPSQPLDAEPMVVESTASVSAETDTPIPATTENQTDKPEPKELAAPPPPEPEPQPKFSTPKSKASRTPSLAPSARVTRASSELSSRSRTKTHWDPLTGRRIQVGPPKGRANEPKRLFISISPKRLAAARKP
ncbi:hypothetical protein DFP72DRAFT_620406 [Ephemerocybe angulata]|uniref:Uncharacterized protein n=1 Tax=Ephemerocybe angulata TaxID=980116 RepID=A0A8H6HI09_9AGAR|nr:hypothetical protein DFP72DRAFT_620406 [Tulosesus angulatus]